MVRKTSKTKITALIAAAAAVIIAAIALLPSAVTPGETLADSSAPYVILDLNLQNFTVITDTEHDWYTSARPTQKGLYQIAAAYEEGEGAQFTFAKNENRADPMIYLPVYDLCYNVNIRNYPYFAVCYKSTATNQNCVCYFATQTSAGLHETKTFGLTLSPTDDWAIAVGKPGNNRNWNGRLTQLRFDISSGEFSGQYTVKWIGFFKSENDAQAFGVNGSSSYNTVTPDKTTYGRGEQISFSVTNANKGDWAVLVQKGDACYAPSVNKPDLYVSECMPLYFTEIENGRGVIDVDETGGIYQGELLPAGEYDVVFMPRGRFVEVSRTTVTIEDEIVRTPQKTEPVYVTRGPDPTETPQATDEPEDNEPTPAQTEGRNRITLAPTAVPSDNSGSVAGPVIFAVVAVICAAVLAIFFVARRKKRVKAK